MKFSIEKFEPVHTTRTTQLRALFDLRIEGLGVIYGCRYLQAKDGEPYVYGPSVRDAYSGGWARILEFDKDFAERVCRAIDKRAATVIA